MPANWKLLCRLVVLRDIVCRRCGVIPVLDGFHIDHVIPRRLGGKNGPDNLVALCPPCHAWKTQRCEPALYNANLQPFTRFVALLRRAGSAPTSAAIARAYARLKELQA